jgi:hypothetical protein
MYDDRTKMFDIEDVEFNCTWVLVCMTINIPIFIAESLPLNIGQN